MRTSWVTEAGEVVRTCPRCAQISPRSKAYCSACGTKLAGEPQATDSLEIGGVVDKRYKLLAKLGEGGMGAVYRVEHVRMGKIMALKVMTPDLVRDRSVAERFRREAQLVAKLDHPNIISVFDSGETDSGILYLVMEYIQGKDLSAVLREEGRLGVRRALELTVPVLRGLQVAHDAGIVHRDVKTANVMLAQGLEPVIKILDFGVATVIEGHREGAAHITGAQDVIGTPSCMSPEQARGAKLDRRSDVYSVSAMLFELIAGRPVFTGAPLQVIAQHAADPPPRLRSIVPDAAVPAEVESILARGLAKDPAERFQSADELRRAIERALGGKSAAAERPLEIARREDWEAFERGFKRERTWVRVIAAAVVLAASYGGATAVQRAMETPVKVRAPVSREEEPNDVPAMANLIAPGKPVRGHIGVRRVPSVSDQDVFELDLRAPAWVSISVDGVPNVNLVLEILRGVGPRTQPWVGIDDAPLSTGEELSDLEMPQGLYYLRLSDRHRLDEVLGVPRENSTDAYVLRVTTESPRPFAEKEPNNRREEAMALAIDRPVLGRGGTPGLRTMVREGEVPLPTWSVDHFSVSAPAAHERVCVVLGGLPFAALKLTLLPAKDDARALRHAPSVTVREEARALCARNEGALGIEVRVVEGSTGDATYPLAIVGSGPGGGAGLAALAAELEARGRSVEAAAMRARVAEVLPGTVGSTTATAR